MTAFQLAMAFSAAAFPLLIKVRIPCPYAFSSTRCVAYSEVLRSVMENPNA